MSPESLISESNVAAVITDPRIDDNPIVVCNEAFIQLTGYSRDEIVGRNCRFLRGELTQPERTAMLREAVNAVRPAIVELINYRKNGATFRNAVMVAPLFDEGGELRYFLGSQMAIKDAPGERNERVHDRLTRLTRRQGEVLDALARGRMNKQIAYELDLSERTVKMHRAALLRALGVRTTAEAIRIAIEAGL